MLGFESFIGWISLEDIGSSSIGCAVYSRRLNNNGLKRLQIDIYICIHSKALWNKLRSHDVIFLSDT
ncbi:unnamed protein product [Hymenolepis diminuta]|uniref:Uncharacterized protein n=1 Tax=Hymenolepis diminuta TaxID=6216 RepID=A0A564Y4Z7_HYMDI|nr:unnamed protein product [Hymenolepis diminuta]